MDAQAPAMQQDTADLPKGVLALTVTSVTHYTDRLFHFATTRPPSFRFRSGEFVMIGLPGGDKPIYRAYSVASPSWGEELEFFSSYLRILGIYKASPMRAEIARKMQSGQGA